jgi:nucleotide-binding universal stress UspA family protein
MVPLRTILVPYDFSAHAEAALRSAVSLARTSQGEVHLLHSCGLPIGAMRPYEEVIPSDLPDSIRRAASERLEAVRRDAAARGVPVSAEVTSVFPVEAVLAAAEKLGADLIVAGTRGLTGLKHAVLGSVAERIGRLAPCPVLTVRRSASGEPPKRIVLATDFSEAAGRALRVGVDLAKQLGAETHVVHAFEVPLEPLTRYGVAIPTEIVPVARKEARRRLDAAVEGIRAAGVAAQGHLVEAPAADAIAEVAKSVGADLVVAGTHGYTGLRHLLLGSVAERTLRLAPCSMLIVRTKGEGAV